MYPPGDDPDFLGDDVDPHEVYEDWVQELQRDLSPHATTEGPVSTFVSSNPIAGNSQLDDPSRCSMEGADPSLWFDFAAEYYRHNLPGSMSPIKPADFTLDGQPSSAQNDQQPPNTVGESSSSRITPESHQTEQSDASPDIDSGAEGTDTEQEDGPASSRPTKEWRRLGRPREEPYILPSQYSAYMPVSFSPDRNSNALSKQYCTTYSDPSRERTPNWRFYKEWKEGQRKVLISLHRTVNNKTLGISAPVYFPVVTDGEEKDYDGWNHYMNRKDAIDWINLSLDELNKDGSIHCSLARFKGGSKRPRSDGIESKTSGLVKSLNSLMWMNGYDKQEIGGREAHFAFRSAAGAPGTPSVEDQATEEVDPKEHILKEPYMRLRHEAQERLQSDLRTGSRGLYPDKTQCAVFGNVPICQTWHHEATPTSGEAAT